VTEPTQVRIDHLRFLTSVPYREEILAWVRSRPPGELAVLVLEHEADQSCCRLWSDVEAANAGSLG
jgi:hypothetical protein